MGRTELIITMIAIAVVTSLLMYLLLAEVV